MDDDKLVRQLCECWEQRKYMEALTRAWQLPHVYDYYYVLSVLPPGGDQSLPELIFRACQEAVAIAWQGQFEYDKAQKWVDELLGKFPPPPALVDHGDESDAESYRVQMIRAHLECARVALSGQWSSRTVSPPALERIARETHLTVGFLRDLVQALLSEKLGGGQLRQPKQPAQPASVTALLVGEAQGVIATLTLELMEEGTGTLYPALDLAFVRRDQKFRDAEQAACAYIWQEAALWQKPPQWDVRWRLQRRDGQPITALIGPSMGLAFTFGMAKLLVAE